MQMEPDAKHKVLLVISQVLFLFKAIKMLHNRELGRENMKDIEREAWGR